MNDYSVKLAFLIIFTMGLVTNVLLPHASASSTLECCRLCTTGKACGDTCIDKDQVCHVGSGCACNDYSGDSSVVVDPNKLPGGDWDDSVPGQVPPPEQGKAECIRVVDIVAQRFENKDTLLKGLRNNVRLEAITDPPDASGAAITWTPPFDPSGQFKPNGRTASWTQQKAYQSKRPDEVTILAACGQQQKPAKFFLTVADWELKRIRGLRKPFSISSNRFKSEKNPHQDGSRIFVGTTDKWKGGALEIADKNKQRVLAIARLWPVSSTFNPKEHIALWHAYDPDDPADLKTVDTNGPSGNDNTGTPHEDSDTWFEARVAGTMRARKDNIDPKAKFIGSITTELIKSDKPYPNSALSLVYFFASDDGGDNFQLSATLDPASYPAKQGKKLFTIPNGWDSRIDRSGTMEVWRKRFLNVYYMKGKPKYRKQDRVKPHNAKEKTLLDQLAKDKPKNFFPSSSGKRKQLEKSLHRYYATGTDDDSKVYLDFSINYQDKTPYQETVDLVRMRDSLFHYAKEHLAAFRTVTDKGDNTFIAKNSDNQSFKSMGYDPYNINLVGVNIINPEEKDLGYAYPPTAAVSLWKAADPSAVILRLKLKEQHRKFSGVLKKKVDNWVNGTWKTELDSTVAHEIGHVLTGYGKKCWHNEHGGSGFHHNCAASNTNRHNPATTFCPFHTRHLRNTLGRIWTPNEFDGSKKHRVEEFDSESHGLNECSL